MQELSFSSGQTTAVRFDRAGRSGLLRAFYGVTGRPSDSGFSALPGWAGETAAGVGFPTLKCTVESDEPGYRSILGWIQWVTQTFHGKREPARLVDRAPSCLDRDIPFMALGYSPAFFDAPAFNSLPGIDWRATVYLTTFPLLSRREAIVPLAGFRWGYRIDAPGERPVPYPLELAGSRDWRSVRREVSYRQPKWKFAGNFRTPAVTQP